MSSHNSARLRFEQLEGRDVPAGVSGLVWHDADGNGTAGAGEGGVGGITVDFLDNSTTVLGSAATAANGTYELTGLPAGDGWVRFTLPTVSPYSFQYPGSGMVDKWEYVTVGSGSLAVNSAVYTVPPVVSVAEVWDAVEGGAWGVFRFTRTGDTDDALSFNYTVHTGASGDATPGTDYDTLSGTATFPAGASWVDVEVVAGLDALTESPEAVRVEVAAGTVYDAATGEATVLISDPGPTTVSVMKLTNAAEGDDDGVFVFSRTGNLSNALTVTYTVETVGPGLATPGTDYTSLSGSVTIPAGAAYAEVSVAALTDSVVEGAEAVTVHISTSGSYTIDEGDATLYVTDTQAVVWIDSSPSSVHEDDSGEIVFKRSGGNIDEELVVPVNISVGDNENLVWVRDFLVTGISGDWSGWNTVTFPPGVDTVAITLDAVLDDELEDDEDVTIELDTGNSGYTAGVVSSVIVPIINVIPNITVPVQAGEPLNAEQARLLGVFLARYGRYGKVPPGGVQSHPDRELTQNQFEEMNRFLDRFNRFGLQSEGLQRLQQLQRLLDALSNVPGPVGSALELYQGLVGTIVGGFRGVEEGLYTRFTTLMGGTTGQQAATRFAEIQRDSPIPREYHLPFWIRYQAEKLGEQLRRPR